MDVSVVIVSWNVRDLLARCILSIQDASHDLLIEIIIVDNDSHDGSADMVENKFGNVQVVRMGRNAGYAAACNRGISVSRGRYVFILNPDTELRSATLQQLVRRADELPDIGMFSPKIVHADGSFQIGSLRRNPTIASQLLLKLLHVGPLWKRIPSLRRYFMLDIDISQPRMVDQVMGAAMFIRREALDRVGTFDERFFIWFEDVDLCKRFQKAGIAMQYFPDAVVVHHGGESFKQRRTVRKQWYYNHSLIKYMLKHHGVIPASVFIILLPFQMFAAFMYQSIHRNARQ